MYSVQLLLYDIEKDDLIDVLFSISSVEALLHYLNFMLSMPRNHKTIRKELDIRKMQGSICSVYPFCGKKDHTKIL